MIIKQRRLDRMISKQRQMFPHERLVVDEPCALTPFQCPQCPTCDLSTYHVSNRIVVIETCKWKPDYYPVSALGQREMNTYNPCNFFCEDCDMPVTIHRYGRPFIDGRGYLVRRCLNDGTNRAHTKDDYPRCTDKYVILKRRQIRWDATPDASGIGCHNIEQMVDVEGQMERERQRQLARENTNVRPSDFDPVIRQQYIQRLDAGHNRPESWRGETLVGEVLDDPYLELIRNTTEPHDDCGGCAGYYDATGLLIQHEYHPVA